MDEVLFANYEAVKQHESNIADLIRRINANQSTSASGQVVVLLEMLRSDVAKLRDELKKLWEDF